MPHYPGSRLISKIRGFRSCMLRRVLTWECALMEQILEPGVGKVESAQCKRGALEYLFNRE